MSFCPTRQAEDRISHHNDLRGPSRKRALKQLLAMTADIVTFGTRLYSAARQVSSAVAAHPRSSSSKGLLRMTIKTLWRYLKEVSHSYYSLAGLATTMVPVISSHFNIAEARIEPFLLPLLVIGWVLAGFGAFTRILDEKDEVERQSAIALKECKDTCQVEVGELREEIRRLTVQQPEILFGVRSGSQVAQELSLEFQTLPPVPDIADEVAKRRTRLLSRLDELPDRGPRPPGSGKSLPVIEWAIGGYDDEQYRKDVEEYCRMYAVYLEDAYRYAIVGDRTRVLLPVLVNKGAIAVRDVEIRLLLPAPLELPREEDERWLGPERSDFAPRPPVEPVLKLKARFDRPSWSPSFTPPTFPVIHASSARISGPTFTEVAQGIAVVYRLDSLNPGSEEDGFDPVEVWFGGFAKNVVVEIPFEVFASSLSEPRRGSITLRIASAKA